MKSFLIVIMDQEPMVHQHKDAWAARVITNYFTYGLIAVVICLLARLFYQKWNRR